MDGGDFLRTYQSPFQPWFPRGEESRVSLREDGSGRGQHGFRPERMERGLPPVHLQRPFETEDRSAFDLVFGFVVGTGPLVPGAVAAGGTAGRSSRGDVPPPPRLGYEMWW